MELILPLAGCMSMTACCCVCLLFINFVYVSYRDLRIFEIRFEFESDAFDSISDGLIRNFRIGRTCRHTTNYSHCSTKTSTVVPL